MTPEVSQRLKEITVDVKDGDYAEDDDRKHRASETGSGSAARYVQLQGVDRSQGQEIPLTVKTDIKEENGAWTVNETAQTPQGEIV